MYQCKAQKLHSDIKTSDNLIRLSAYDLLARIGVNTLPVVPDRIFDMDSVYYSTLKRLAEHVGVSREHLISLGAAGLIYREQSGRDCIYVNTNGGASQTLWNMALALGALELDIVPYNTCFPIPEDDPAVSDFAYYFLAPDAVLEASGFCSQEKILQNCRLPFRESVKKAMRIQRHVGKPKQTGVEKIILSNFRHFIDEK